MAGYAFDLNVMPLDAHMPDAGQLVRAMDIYFPARADGTLVFPLVVFEDPAVRVSVIPVTHGRVMPAFAYPRFVINGCACRFEGAAGSGVRGGVCFQLDRVCSLVAAGRAATSIGLVLGSGQRRVWHCRRRGSWRAVSRAPGVFGGV